MNGVEVKASEIKALVEAGKTLDDIRNTFKDAKGKAMSRKEAKDILTALDLKIKKQRVPKFVLNNDLNNSEVE